MQSGNVLIDGHDVRDYKLKHLRDQIGYVLQDTVLFRGTIFENIAFGRPDATREEIIAAAKLANADEFIMAMPLGYDTLVGERGSTLSGGQRQRIGIARVMVRNSPILLLDEPTAALDSESEKLVIDALEKLMKGKTVIAIAHRLSTIRDADQIIVIEDGVVAESGTHDELMARNGTLRRTPSHPVRRSSDKDKVVSIATAELLAQLTPEFRPLRRKHHVPVPSSFYLTTPPSPSSTPSRNAKKSLRIKMFVFSDPSTPPGRHRRAQARRQSAHHAQPRAARRRKRERRHAQDAHRGRRQRSSTAIPPST